jgi:hypothetical protein
MEFNRLWGVVYFFFSLVFSVLSLVLFDRFWSLLGLAGVSKFSYIAVMVGMVFLGLFAMVMLFVIAFYKDVPVPVEEPAQPEHLLDRLGFPDEPPLESEPIQSFPDEPVDFYPPDDTVPLDVSPEEFTPDVNQEQYEEVQNE